MGGWPDIRAAEFPHGRGKHNIVQVMGEEGDNGRQVKDKEEGCKKKKKILQSVSSGLNL